MKTNIYISTPTQTQPVTTNSKNIPVEIWFEVCRYMDIYCLSSLACVNKYLNTMITEKLYDIIDSSCVITVGDFKLVPRTQATYQRFRYVIDFATLQYNKYKFSDEVIYNFCDIIDFEQLSSNQKLSDDILYQFYRRISLPNLLRNQVLPNDLLERLIQTDYAQLDNSHWHAVWANQNVSQQFIEQYLSHIDWYALSQNKQVMSTEFFNCYQNRLFWPELSKLGVSEELVRSFANRLDPFSWQNVAYSSRLSSKFIREFWTQLQSSVMILLVCQELDEALLEQIIENCDPNERQDIWNKIANSQPLTESFIRQHFDHLPLRFLIRNTKIKRKVLANVYGKLLEFKN